MRRRRPGDPGPEVELPVTPMLDMAFQLLMFFIFTYHPSALEVQMELNLPAAGEARAKDMKDVDPSKISDTEIEEPTQVTVIAKTQLGDKSDGRVSQIIVDGLAKTTLGNVKELETYLRRLNGPDKQYQHDKLSIKADGGLRWSHIVEIMDACKKAGFANIGFGPPPDGGAAKEEK